jgi:hypothetical protein
MVFRKVSGSLEQVSVAEVLFEFRRIFGALWRVFRR